MISSCTKSSLYWLVSVPYTEQSFSLDRDYRYNQEVHKILTFLDSIFHIY